MKLVIVSLAALLPGAARASEHRGEWDIAPLVYGGLLLIFFVLAIISAVANVQHTPSTKKRGGAAGTAAPAARSYVKWLGHGALAVAALVIAILILMLAFPGVWDELWAAPALLVMAVALAALAGLGFTAFRGSTWFGAFAAFVAFLAVLPFALSLMFPAFMGAMWAGAATQPTLAIGLVLLIGLMLVSLNLGSVAAKFVAVLVFAPLALGVGITLVGGVDAFTKPTIEQHTYSARIGQWAESIPLDRNCFRFTAVQHAVPVRARFVDRNNRFDDIVVSGFPAEIRPTPGFHPIAVAFQASENHSLLMTPNRPVRIVHGTILNIPDGEYERITQAPDPAAAQSEYCGRMAREYRALLRRR